MTIPAPPRSVRTRATLLARRLARAHTHLLLWLLYWIVVTPWGLAVRCFADPLRVRREPGSTWVPRPGRLTLGDARRQY